MAETTASQPVTTAQMRRQMLAEFWFYFSENRGAVIGLVVFVALVLIAVFADVIAPHSPFEQYREAVLLPPAWLEGGNWSFVLGTDPVGRDILSRMIWGAQPMFVSLPESLSGTVELFGFSYPTYRFLIIGVGLLVAAGSQWLIHKTRVGMLIRAGSVNPQMVGALGVNIRLLNAMLFALGAGLAALAGAMAGPILSVQSGMGEPVLITTLVVIVIGGIGSVHGALYAGIIVGLVDTLGRTFLPLLMREFADREVAQLRIPPHSIEAESSVLGGLLLDNGLPYARLSLLKAAGAPEFLLLPKEHPLAGVHGVNNAILVEGDPVGRVMFYGPGAGAGPRCSPPNQLKPARVTDKPADTKQKRHDV